MLADQQPHIGPSPFGFPGHELVGDSYRQAMASNQRHDYLGATRTIIALLELSVGLDEQDEERVRRSTVAIGGLDDLVDETSVEHRATALQLYAELAGTLATQAPLPQRPETEWAPQATWDLVGLWRNSILELPAAQKEQITQTVLRIGEISVEKATAPKDEEYQSIEDYAKKLEEEGHLVFYWIAQSLSPEARSAKQFARLEKWGRKVGACGVLFLASLHLPEDVEKKLCAAQSSRSNRVRLLGRSARYLPAVMWGLGFRGVGVVARAIYDHSKK